eukprot:CAMPEP_0115542830 /NCGR_PEP_ID=MMETSP0271-20121206/91217_1 /TAXON_ID=71861 /ORGANISM="Scrippsiella trochoidea, Strain CCMP3099" /LENGTH=41 /DNA_ID= /DNA_START= /DNA_END= /DNA_ORIENTATION=
MRENVASEGVTWESVICWLKLFATSEHCIPTFWFTRPFKTI